MGGQEPREEHDTRIHNNPSCPMIPPPPPCFLPFISSPVLSSVIFPLVSLINPLFHFLLLSFFFFSFTFL